MFLLTMLTSKASIRFLINFSYNESWVEEGFDDEDEEGESDCSRTWDFWTAVSRRQTAAAEEVERRLSELEIPESPIWKETREAEQAAVIAAEKGFKEDAL